MFERRTNKPALSDLLYGMLLKNYTFLNL